MKPKTSPEDKMIGGNVREYRLIRGMTQEELASAIGVTFQQLQKYELGHNRVAATRLLLIAKALKVEPQALLPVDNYTQREDIDISLDDPDVREMLSLYNRIHDANLRQEMIKLLRELTRNI